MELIRLTQNVAVWIFALKAKDPVPMAPPVDLRVALLTTIPPSPERIDAVERALRGLKDIVYRGPVDIWIVDDGADPTVAAMTERLGFEYISGHESWRADHEHRYDVVARIDPDHVPMPSFLESTLGYFDDPDVAFVVARLLVGTNHLYRPAAWRQTGTDPDPVTAVHTTTNPRTGRHWKGVYAPDVTTVGEGWHPGPPAAPAGRVLRPRATPPPKPGGHSPGQPDRRSQLPGLRHHLDRDEQPGVADAVGREHGELVRALAVAARLPDRRRPGDRRHLVRRFADARSG